LNGLQILNVSDNMFNEIPQVIFNMKNLAVLNIGANLINDLDGVQKIENLGDLSVYNNNISSLDSVDLPMNLVKLDLSINYIKEIPESLLGMTKLKFLNLSYNDITDISMLVEKNFDESVVLSGNPLSEMVNGPKDNFFF